MSNKPLISFITPVYNNEILIHSVAKSILSQTDDDIEYIIVDDGSTDNTPSVVDEIAKNDNRVKVIHQNNQWIYASFNNGIKEAKGEYIYIINSDDVLRNNSYEKMKKVILSYHPDVIWTNVLIHKCDQNQNIIEYDYLNRENAILDNMYCCCKEEVRGAWTFFDKSLLALNQANLYKRELMVKHPFRNDVYGADTLFNLSIARDITSCYVLKDATYDYFEYIDERNASVGKYYENEHSMFNEIFSLYREMYIEFGNVIEDYEFIYNRRMKQYTFEIRHLQNEKCMLSIDEKIKKIMSEYLDDTMLLCAKEVGREEELESRTLSGIRELLCTNMMSESSEYYFMYELLESLLRYEKEREDYEKIRKAIDNPRNKYSIGKYMFSKLQNSKQ